MQSGVIKSLIFMPVALLAACADDDTAQERAEDQVEMAAETSAAQSGNTIVALGLTEWELLDGELRSTDGRELADVAAIRRDTEGTVDRLLVEIEDSNPDRYVEVPIEGLTVQRRGDDIDLVTSMTADDLMALPEVALSEMPAAPTPAAT